MLFQKTEDVGPKAVLVWYTVAILLLYSPGPWPDRKWLSGGC